MKISSNVLTSICPLRQPPRVTTWKIKVYSIWKCRNRTLRDQVYFIHFLISSLRISHWHQSVWPDLAKIKNFERVQLVFARVLIILWPILNAIGQILIVDNGKILNGHTDWALELEQGNYNHLYSCLPYL